ncbi:molybdenum cofactor biosysynthesis protein [Bosea sp. Leaf344]|uniref:MOSC domain-containing protein n=1 Tax=Bosea sp. Leaf344 TaxID=1736346 RepID=UPI0006FAEFB0|nr:MOSC domain-containing protein [Bosea sp. Leaf344]KQU52656.1 molybdenum cofactor biosysynthesis protein [Bosea sp. Leaf344]
MGIVVSVSAEPGHGFSKTPRAAITLLPGLGVEGDAHCGATVRHRSRVAADPLQPNLRQLHLFPAEWLEALDARGFDLAPGGLGENLLTRGLDLLALPTGTLLRFSQGPLVAVTGLRNPCRQIEAYRQGLLAAVLDRDAEGAVVLKAGIMAVILEGGVIAPGDSIGLSLPPEPHRKLQRV